jgi:hypothetical protein
MVYRLWMPTTDVSAYSRLHREGAPTSRELFGSIADIVHSFDGEFVAG